MRRLASSRAAPSTSVHFLCGCPSPFSGDTNVVSVASCAPLKRGRPSTTTSSLRPSACTVSRARSRHTHDSPEPLPSTTLRGGGHWSQVDGPHDSLRTPNVHISGFGRFKHHQNSTRRPQEREERKKIVAPHPSRPTLRGPTLRGPFFLGSGPHPSGAHVSGFEAPLPFWAPEDHRPPEPAPHPNRPPLPPPSHHHPTFKTWFGQSWLVFWPKLVLAKFGLAKVGVGQTQFGPTSQNSLAKVRLAQDGNAPDTSLPRHTSTSCH